MSQTSPFFASLWHPRELTWAHQPLSSPSSTARYFAARHADVVARAVPTTPLSIHPSLQPPKIWCGWAAVPERWWTMSCCRRRHINRRVRCLFHQQPSNVTPVPFPSLWLVCTMTGRSPASSSHALPLLLESVLWQLHTLTIAAADRHNTLSWPSPWTLPIPSLSQYVWCWSITKNTEAKKRRKGKEKKEESIWVLH